MIIYNEDCKKTMQRDDFKTVDIILTSPPYNTGRPSTSEAKRDNYEARYDSHIDDMSQDGYCKWCIDMFNAFNNILKLDGAVLWNVSYGSDAEVNRVGVGLMWLAIADIIRNTNFIVADRIIWKKHTAIPNNRSPNKLTRIVEDVFVFCRKDEYKTFHCNKAVVSVSKKGQNNYENIYNFIEADNNDGACKLNKATFSTELVKKLLNIYIAPGDGLVYDPFGGTMTTMVACEEYGIDCICSEISKEQCKYGKGRLKDESVQIIS